LFRQFLDISATAAAVFGFYGFPRKVSIAAIDRYMLLLGVEKNTHPSNKIHYPIPMIWAVDFFGQG